MKNNFLGSLNQKFIFAITIGFLSTSVLFMVVFTHLYASQLERERTQTHNKSERMLEIYIQNTQLKQELKKVLEYKAEEALTQNSIGVSYNKFGAFFLSQENILNRQDDLTKILDYDVIRKVTLPFAQEETPMFLMDSDTYELRYRAMVIAARLVGAGALLIVLVMAAMYALMNYFVINPVEKLVFASGKLAEGDLTARVDIAYDQKRNDEMKQLALAFNKMAENLQTSLKEIELKERFQQALIDAIPDGIRVIDNEFRIISFNKAYQRYAGKIDTSDNINYCYQSSHKRKNPCPSALTTCPLIEIRKKPEAISAVQGFILPNGKEKYVEVRAAPINFDDDNKKQDLLIVESIRDLTNDIRFSHQQKLSSVGLLATSVAHEMRNPLGSVRLVIDGLINRIGKSDMSFDEIVKYLKMINEQLVVCIDVTERLLKMGRFPSGGFEKINCCNAVKETVSLLDYEAKKQGITVKVKVPENPVYVMASESELRIVIVNLVQNAFSAIDKEGEITVSVEENDEKVLIKVADNGKGIEKSKIARIFEPFFSDRKRKDFDDKEGTGLGLTITKSIIEKFGGDIKVESILFKGTTFEISFLKKNQS